MDENFLAIHPARIILLGPKPQVPDKGQHHSSSSLQTNGTFESHINVGLDALHTLGNQETYPAKDLCPCCSLYQQTYRAPMD